MAPVAAAVTRVLITGFGPFGGVPINPSWGIASRLPASIPDSNIELIVHPSYVPVAYHPTINLVPQLIAQHQPDIVLSMGVAAGRQYFAVEQTSQKNGYEWSQDIEGQVFSVAEQAAVWGSDPTVLSTELDLPAVVAGWQEKTASIKWPADFNSADPAFRTQPRPVELKLFENVLDAPDMHIQDEVGTDDVRWSDAVGSYLCGFIYYADMVEMSKNGKNKKRDVAFMHVPSLNTEDELQMGVEITIALVQSLVESWKAQKG